MNKLALRVGTALAILAAPLPALAEPIHALLYKNPQCSCCEGYAAYLRQNGFEVEVKASNDLASISSKAGVGVGVNVRGAASASLNFVHLNHGNRILEIVIFRWRSLCAGLSALHVEPAAA